MATPDDLFQICLERLGKLEAALRPIAQQHELSSQDLMRAIRGRVSGDDDYGLATAVLSVQAKARRKLGGEFWWCDERSLAQSTPMAVAKRKARWIGKGDALDLCCGIGADSISLVASRGSVGQIQAIDADDLIAAMAHRNLANQQSENVASNWNVRAGRAEEISVSADSWVHVDPDRRSNGGRTIDVDHYSPSWDSVETVAQTAIGALVKVAPAAMLEDHPDRHRIWISLRGSVREQTVVFGQSIAMASEDLEVSLAGGGRSAIAVTESGDAVTFHADAERIQSDLAERVEKPRDYLIDPDAAIRAAALTDAFAVFHGAATLGGPTGFLTADAAIETPNAICKRVLWSGTSDDRKLRKTLRQMNSYPQRVKTRGAAGDANSLERRYRSCGDQPVTLWIGKAGRRQYAAISEA